MKKYKCKSCLYEMPEEDFYNNEWNESGLELSSCKQCKSEYSKLKRMTKVRSEKAYSKLDFCEIGIVGQDDDIQLDENYEIEFEILHIAEQEDDVLESINNIEKRRRIIEARNESI